MLALVSTLAWGEASDAPPTFRLGDAATPTAYDARLAIDPKAAAFEGEIRIQFRMNRAGPVVWLNATKLAISSVDVKQGERAVDVDVVASGEDFVGLKSKGEPFAAGDTVATLRYRGTIDAVSQRGLFVRKEGGESYAITQHEEFDARRTFPCFDEPQWKTPWRITIDAPAANVVVSNAPEARASDLADRPGWRRHEFAVTKPLTSYLVALAVGPFDVVDGGSAGVNRTPLRYLTAKGRGAEARYAKEITPRLIEILEAAYGIPYPFEKLDSLARPDSVNSFAMENAGLITYGTDSMLARPSGETLQFRRSYAGVAAHEIAHMWFGDLVTLAWWDDVWLNEAFATWMGRKATYRFEPRWDTGYSRARSRSSALAVDRLASARRVRNPILAQDEIHVAFDSITYRKGAMVLEMFEAWLGEERFREGVRGYLQKHAWGSATSTDFFAAIGAASGRGPEALAAFEGFVDQSGVPLLDVDLDCRKGASAIAIAAHRLRPAGSKAEERKWNTPACFRSSDGKTHCDTVAGAESIDLGAACPAWVVGNAGGTGYYVARYSPALLARILKGFASLPPHEAATLAADSSLLAGSGLLPVESALDVADASLRHRSPGVQATGVRLLDALPDAWLNAAQLRRKHAVLGRLQSLARDVGWTRKPKEAEEMSELRVVLLPLAARSAGGAKLRSQARTLAITWMRDRDALPDEMEAPTLETAARFADRATYDLLESLAVTSTDPLDRRRLQAALAHTRDPALRSRAFNLVLQKRAGSDLVSPREARLFLDDALEDEFNRAAAFEFVRANFDALVAKLPPNQPAGLMVPLRQLCTAADREAFFAFFGGQPPRGQDSKTRAARFEGGKRRFDEALESIDLCVAARSG